MNAETDQVRLTGQLICANKEEATIVQALLPEHIRLTQLEEGCISFTVAQDSNPLAWNVDEEFRDADAFRLHQNRVEQSEWGRSTLGMERNYTITGLQ